MGLGTLENLNWVKGIANLYPQPSGERSEKGEDVAPGKSWWLGMAGKVTTATCPANSPLCSVRHALNKVGKRWS